MDSPILVPVDLIDPNPYQPRQAEDSAAVAEIADSIARNGLMQVPTARRVEDRYQLAFGHTRLAAFKMLQEPCMPLIIRELDDLQMFELGVSENIKRRDLNPIEQAEAMKRYMQDFKKNSVETGEFFNVSPEKVRSAIRLLKLPDKLRAGVADGTISQNNARRLLTIQRIAPDQVQSVATSMKENADPDHLIGRTLKNLDRSVEMWESWQKGEPKGGSNLWTLNTPADKFPSQYLPALKPADVAKSLSMEYTPELRSQIQDYIDSAQRNPDFVSAFVETADGVDPEKAKIMERIGHLMSPPSCTACPFYAKLDGDHYCALRLCHTRKTHAWETHIIESASKKLGIRVYDPKVDGKEREDLSSWQDADKKLFTARHADLRLVAATSYQSFEGLPGGVKLIVVGKTAKSRLKRVEARVQDNDSYYKEQRRLAAIRTANEKAIYNFLWEVATPAFASVYNGMSTLPFIEFVAERFVSGVPAEEPDKKATKKEKLEFYQRAILFAVFDDELWDYKIDENRKAVQRLAKHLQGIAKTWGVSLPKDWMEKAVQADKAITVTAETVA